jgi:hypothetical protein
MFSVGEDVEASALYRSPEHALSEADDFRGRRLLSKAKCVRSAVTSTCRSSSGSVRLTCLRRTARRFCFESSAGHLFLHGGLPLQSRIWLLLTSAARGPARG